MSEIPMAIGEAYGVRSFKVDRLNRLISPMHSNFVFKPGENISECEHITKNKPHYGATFAECSCGFYANTHTREYSYDVHGVIKQYGTTVIGYSGQRSEKCEIVGLVISSDAPWWIIKRHYNWLYRKDLEALPMVFGAIAVLLAIVFGVAAFIDAMFILGPLMVIAAIAGLWWFMHGWWSAEQKFGSSISLNPKAALKALYPGVKFFRRESDMLDYFGLVPYVKRLEPGSEDFWNAPV